MSAHDFSDGSRGTDGVGESITEYEEPLSQDDSEEIQTDAESQTESDVKINEEAPEVTVRPNFTNTGRPGIGTIPRTVPLRRHMGSRSMDISSASVPKVISVNTTGSSTSSSTPSSYALARSKSPTSPLFSSLTGTRYGVALTGVATCNTGGIGLHGTGGVLSSPTGGSPRKWGSGTPSCPRCGKSVYFAEQVRAVGKTFHKACLRCVECGTSLDSHKLRDHDGDPYCVRCYQKVVYIYHVSTSELKSLDPFTGIWTPRQRICALRKGRWLIDVYMAQIICIFTPILRFHDSSAYIFNDRVFM